tara:strand:- start:7334 stop:7459 length:126 start_codon:yes stop_codon:yes gene_type:complete
MIWGSCSEVEVSSVHEFVRVKISMMIMIRVEWNPVEGFMDD